MIKLILLSLLISTASASSFQERSLKFDKLLKAFQNLCVGPDGKILKGTVIIDKEAIKSDGNTLNCEDEAKRLALMLKDLEIELSVFEKENNCAPEDKVLSDGLKENILDISTVSQSPKNQCKEYSDKNCAKNIACNVLRSTTMASLLVMDKIDPDFKAPKCLNSKESACATEFINGVIKDLWLNVDGIWELTKMAGRGIKNAAIASWDYFFGVEDKTSDAAHAASKLKPGMFELFKKDPAGFFKELAMSIWEDMGKAIKTNFGCEEWSGAPHFSKCTKEMSSFGCANCSQRMNAICGVSGVLGGELVVAYISGGTVNLIGKAGGKGAQLFSRAASVVQKYIPKPVSKVVLVGAQQTSNAARAVINSKLAKAIKEFSQKGAAKLKSSATLTVSMKIVKGAASPVTGYFRLMDDSFRLGMKHADMASRKVSSLRQVLTKSSKANQVDELVINLNEYEDISQDVLRAKLKKENVDFEEVTLKDGTRATRVKNHPSCSEGKSQSFLFK